MKDDTNTFDHEDRVHPGPHGGRVPWKEGPTNQRNDYAPAVAVELRRLDHHYKGNRITQASVVAMDVELRHYKGECSSANEPTDAYTAFQSATQASAARWRLRRAFCWAATNSVRSDSMVADRLSV